MSGARDAAARVSDDAVFDILFLAAALALVALAAAVGRAVERL